MKLDIISDPICPWCYIGKTNLDAALLERPGHPFRVEWHPFQLNPTMPAEGMDRRTYLEGKFGGKDAAVRAYAPVVEAAEKVGLNIAFDKIQHTPNTLDAHRLIHWAGIEGRQTAAVSRLFEAYFVEGLDIGDHGVLTEIARAVEMDTEVVASLLSGNADKQDIRDRDAHARERGVQGVPMFIVGERHALSGAQPPELWRQVLDELLGEQSNV